ncbi:hypothetical protein [Lysobacter gummosus]|uniref:hypothetical protein n=1 Tax=Lysobacter gummosus TaxID=262324 RepID=UPI0036317D66
MMPVSATINPNDNQRVVLAFPKRIQPPCDDASPSERRRLKSASSRRANNLTSRCQIARLGRRAIKPVGPCVFRCPRAQNQGGRAALADRDLFDLS